MRDLATATGIPIIDMEEQSWQWLLRLGPDGSAPFFVLDKRDPAAMDNTHLTREGAEVIAGMIAGNLKELNIWQ